MKDILLGDDGDLDFVNGDFVIGDSEYQNAMLTIDSFKGEWKQNPLVGFGASQYKNGITDQNVFSRELKIALEMDGIKISELEVDSDLRTLTFEIDI